MPVAPAEHDGITGVTFGSDGHRLLGTLYLARGSDPRLRAVAACAAAVDIGALDLDSAEIEREFTRFLAVTPDEFRRQRDEAAARLDPLAAAAAIAPRPLLIVHGTADPWVPVAHARRLAGPARHPFRYAEIDGGGHDFAWQRSYFRELVTGWLDEIQI